MTNQRSRLDDWDFPLQARRGLYPRPYPLHYLQKIDPLVLEGYTLLALGHNPPG
ncbi:hypothetical protein HanRHA438_Chr10g0450871 [Helianthus annuus]|nr:hypothetical protein HanRHA438_Chr10g0450871 [Helianthus annuus]